MRRIPKLREPHSFAIVVGFTDGILNALTLAADHFIAEARPSVALSLRIGFGSAICGVFVFFTAEYGRLRSELLDAERQLNLVPGGTFATTSLEGKLAEKPPSLPACRVEPTFWAPCSRSYWPRSFLGHLNWPWCRPSRRWER